jgi:Zn-dependent peptidase ImmA (M78 family)/transcriptional regulator with XRE-family HTH domain
MDNPNTFGDAARLARLDAGLTLREAAKKLRNPESDEPLSPSYLSKIELNRCEPPSADLILQMAKLYGVRWEFLGRFAEDRVTDVIGEEVHRKEELLKLYRLGKDLTPEQLRTLIDDLIARLPEKDRAECRQKLESEFPRENRRHSMFAPQVHPRCLSWSQIRVEAERVLTAFGIGRTDYSPPTPIEEIIERTDGVRLHPCDDLARIRRSDGSPIVLGVTKWDPMNANLKLIEINQSLYSSDNDVQRHRLRFTLAHEYWHAIEHLDLVKRQVRSPVALRRTVMVETHRNWWTEDGGPRKLKTPEDWREWQANAFAAELLMPEWHVKVEFKKRVGQPSVSAAKGQHPAEVANEIAVCPFVPPSGRIQKAMHQLYDVSRQSMAIRLLKLNLVTA